MIRTALPSEVLEAFQHILLKYKNMNSRGDPVHSDRKSADMVRTLSTAQRGIVEWLSRATGRGDILGDISRPLGNWPEIPWISIRIAPLRCECSTI